MLSLSLDRFYYDNYYNSRPSYGGQQREFADRNWYYQPEDRQRYGDRNSGYDNRFDRNEDRYAHNRPEDRDRYPSQRPAHGAYDRSGNDYYQNDYRGNGYDNRDPAYFNAMRGGGAAGYGGGSGGTAAYGGANAYDAYDGMKLIAFRAFLFIKKAFSFSDRLSNRGYSAGGGGGGGGGGYHSMKPNQDFYGGGGGHQNRDRYAGNAYYDRHSEDRYYADRNQGYRGGYDDRNFQPYDQTFRFVHK